MTFLAILQGLMGFFKFFDQVMAFIRLLEKTPEEKHQEIMLKIGIEEKNFFLLSAVKS
jgi:hypothetical protein